MSDTRALSFATDIRPLFTDIDIQHMAAYGLDLSSRDGVAKEAKQILSVVTAGTMPPPSSDGKRWTPEMIETFQQWADQGCPP